MSDYVELAVQRLAWARRYLELFHSQAVGFIESDAHEVVYNKELVGEKIRRTWVFHSKQPIPNEFSFAFGDIVHNIRAVCDNLVSALGWERGYTTKSRLYFPVCLDSGGTSPDKGFAKFRTDHRRLGPDVLDVLEMLQPYNACTDREGRTWVGEDHPVYILDHLWGYDKHKVPLSMRPVTDGPDMLARRIVGHIGEITVPRDVALEDGATLIEILNSLPDEDFDVEVKPTVYIGLDKPSPSAFPLAADELLFHLHNFVGEQVIPKIAPLFKGPGMPSK